MAWRLDQEQTHAFPLLGVEATDATGVVVFGVEAGIEEAGVEDSTEAVAEANLVVATILFPLVVTHLALVLGPQEAVFLFLVQLLHLVRERLLFLLSAFLAFLGLVQEEIPFPQVLALLVLVLLALLVLLVLLALLVQESLFLSLA